jgi:hypothetical protein
MTIVEPSRSRPRAATPSASAPTDATAAERAPLGPTLALTIVFAAACFMVAMWVVESISTPHRLPPPLGTENQPAESALFTIAFVVILPAALIAVPRLADSIAAGPNGRALSVLAALLTAAFVGSIPLIRALPGGGGLAEAMGAAAIWLGLAGALLTRARQPRPWRPLLRAVDWTAPLWVLNGALALGALLPFADLHSIDPIAVGVGLVVVATVLLLHARRVRARPLARRWGAAIDAAILLVIVLAVPDLDVMQPEGSGSAFLKAFKRTVIQYHQDYVLGPVNAVLHGGAMLVDAASQYGVGLPYFTAGWFKLAPIGYGTFGFLDGLLFAFFYAAAYCVLRLAGTRRALAAAALAVAVVVLIYNLLYPVGSLPAQHGPLRFGLPMGVILAAACGARWPARAKAARVAQLATVGLASIWALEAFAATLVTFAAIVCFAAWMSPGGERLALLGRRAAGAVVACVVAHGALVIGTLVYAGELPDYGWYLAFLHAFVVGNVGEFTFDFAHWSPGLAVGLAYAAAAAAFVLVVRRRPAVAARERVGMIVLAGTIAYGIALYSYFVDRSAPHILPYVCLPAVVAGTLWLSLLLRGALGGSAAARRGGLAFALLLSVLVVGVAWSSVDGRFSRSALGHVVPGGESTGAALHRLWHMPPVDTRSPGGEALLTRYFGGAERVLSVMPSDLETEILIRSGRVNKLPLSFPVEDSFIPGEYLPRLGRTVARLRPGERLLTQVSVVRLFHEFAARPSHDPLVDPRARIGLAPLQAWVIERLAERFDLKVVHRDAAGFVVAVLEPR